MYAFRDADGATSSGMELIVHVEPGGRSRAASTRSRTAPSVHTDVMKTQGLKQALDKYGFDAAFGGARRDEEKSRAKERVFSFRIAQHRWDPKNQRPELWRLYNARKRQARASACSRCRTGPSSTSGSTSTSRSIPIVPLYFAAERPVVERDGTLIMVDDERMPLQPGERPDAQEGALPHARLLPAHRRDRERRRHAAGDHPGDAAAPRPPSARAA